MWYQRNIVGELKRCAGKRLDYLGMVLVFSVPGEVSFDMSDYTKKIMDDFEAITGQNKVAKTPAASHLFQVREDTKKLEEEECFVSHNARAKVLYICKCSRPDIQTAVSFLTTHMKDSDLDDWKKLVRLIGHLKYTLKLGLTLSD